MLVRINNPLVYALNQSAKLPHYIVMVLDKDLIEVAVKEHDDCGFKGMLDDFTNWLIKNINISLETQKSDIYSKCPGALATSAEPRIIWVTALFHPPSTSKKQIFAVVNKFNDVLEKLVRNDKYSHLLEMDTVNEFAYFDV